MMLQRCDMSEHLAVDAPRADQRRKKLHDAEDYGDGDPETSSEEDVPLAPRVPRCTKREIVRPPVVPVVQVARSRWEQSAARARAAPAPPRPTPGPWLLPVGGWPHSGHGAPCFSRSATWTAPGAAARGT